MVLALLAWGTAAAAGISLRRKVTGKTKLTGNTLNPLSSSSSSSCSFAQALHVAWDTMQLWIAVCWEYLLVVMEAQHSLHILSGNTPPWGTDAYWRALKGGLPNAAPKPAAIAEEPEPLAPDAEVDAPLLPPPLARYRSPRPMPPSSPRLPARNAQSPRRKTRLLMRSIELDPKGAMGSRAPTLAFAEEATGGREARFLRPPSVQPRRAAGQRRRAMLEGDVPNTDQRMHSKLMSLLETARERPQVRSTLPPVMPQPKGVLRSKVSSLQMQTRDIETGGDMLYDSDIVGLPPFHTPDILATLSPERPCHHPPPVANPFANLNKSTFGTFGPPLAAAGGRSSAGGSRSTSVQRASSVPRSSGSSAAPAASGGATATSKPAGSASSARRSGGAATADGPAAARDVTPQSRKSRARLNSEGGDRRSPLPAAAEEDGIGGGDDGVEGQQQAEEGGGESTSFARTSGGSRRRTTGSKPGATSGGGGVKLMYHDGVNKVEGAAPAEDGLGATVADGRPVGAAGKVFFDPFGEGPYLDIDNLVPEGHFRTHIRVKACH